MVDNQFYDFPFWAQVPDEVIPQLARSAHWSNLLMSASLIDDPTEQVKHKIELFLEALLNNELVSDYDLYAATEYPYASSFQVDFKHLDRLIAKAIIGSDFLDESSRVCGVAPAGIVKVSNRLYELLGSSDDVKSLHDTMLVAESDAHSWAFQAALKYAFTASAEVTSDIIRRIREGDYKELQQFFQQSLGQQETPLYLPIPLPLFDETEHGKSTSQEVLELLNMWYRSVNVDAQEMSLKQAWMAGTGFAKRFLAGKATLAFKVKNHSLKAARNNILNSLFAEGEVNVPSPEGDAEYNTDLHANMIRYESVGLNQVLYPWGSKLAELAVGEFLKGNASPLSSAALLADKELIPALEKSFSTIDILSLAAEQGIKTTSDWQNLLEKVFANVPLVNEPIVEAVIVQSIEREAYQTCNLEVIQALESIRHRGYRLSGRIPPLTWEHLSSLSEYNNAHGTNVFARYNFIRVVVKNAEEADSVNKLNREDKNLQGKLKVIAAGSIFSEAEIESALAGNSVTLSASTFTADEVIAISLLNGNPVGLEGKQEDFWLLLLDLLKHNKLESLRETLGAAKAALA